MALVDGNVDNASLHLSLSVDEYLRRPLAAPSCCGLPTAVRSTSSRRSGNSIRCTNSWTSCCRTTSPDTSGATTAPGRNGHSRRCAISTWAMPARPTRRRRRCPARPYSTRRPRRAPPRPPRRSSRNTTRTWPNTPRRSIRAASRGDTNRAAARGRALRARYGEKLAQLKTRTPRWMRRSPHWRRRFSTHAPSPPPRSRN